MNGNYEPQTGSVQTDTAKELDVWSALDYQQTSINALHAAVENLLDRLSPLLRLSDEEKSGTPAGLDSADSAPLARTLNKNSFELVEITAKIAYITEKLLQV